MIEHLFNIAAKNSCCNDYTITAVIESTGVYRERLSYYLEYPTGMRRYSSTRTTSLMHQGSYSLIPNLNDYDRTDHAVAGPNRAERQLRELTRRSAKLATLREAEYNRLEKFRANDSHPPPVIKRVQVSRYAR